MKEDDPVILQEVTSQMIGSYSWVEVGAPIGQ